MSNMPLPEEITILSRILNNTRRIHIMNYLELAVIATNSVVARVLKLRPGTVSKDLSLLRKAMLVKREKVGTQQILTVTEKWQKVKELSSNFP